MLLQDGKPVAEINLPMERPLAAPSQAVELDSATIDLTDDIIDDQALFNQFVVDKAVLESKIRRALQGRPQISLAELTDLEPIEKGLAEVVAYLELAHTSFDAVIDDDHIETVSWTVDSTGEDSTDPTMTDAPLIRRARLPRVLFVGAH